MDTLAPPLSISNLSFFYGTSKVIDGLSMTLNPGTTSALIGASGSGKTTLLKLIAGLLTPVSGEIEIQGQSSFLMQEDTLLPWKTVWEQLVLVLELQKKPIDPSALRELLRLLNLSGAEKMYPSQLSGGMKRRVSLAQALLREHALLLLDEPFSSLDTHIRDQLFHLLKIIQLNNRTTVLTVTHDYRDAVTFADEIFWFHAGKIESHWMVSEETRQDPSKAGALVHEIRTRTYSEPLAPLK